MKLASLALGKKYIAKKIGLKKIKKTNVANKIGLNKTELASLVLGKRILLTS